MQTSPWLTLGFLLVSLTAAMALWFLWTHPLPRPVTAAEARAELHRGAINTVIDVRTQAEWDAGHYPHAIHIPLANLTKELPRHLPNRSKSLLIYCRTGRRAAEAAAIAEDLGYTRIQYLIDADHTGLQPKHNILTV